MSEVTGSTAPASSGSEGSSSPAPATEASAQTQASAPAGSAPGGGGDAGVAGEATESPAASPAAQFAFLRRQFRDQKHAEEVLGSEIGMLKPVQRKLAQTEQERDQLRAEIDSLRAIVTARGGQGQGQGAPQAQGTGESQSFAKELAESGELEVIAKIFADPEMGPAHAMYRMAELLDQRSGKQLEQIRNEVRGEFERTSTRSQQERAVVTAFSAAKSLAADYPELDADNHSDEAAEAQQEILEIIKGLPQGPQWLASDPTECLRYAAERYRRMHGAPIFAQPPGVSGSPSSRAAAAAEAAAAASSVAIDGNGVPRQRPNGQPESAVDRIKRENREISTRVAKTPGGRPLGFEVGA